MENSNLSALYNTGIGDFTHSRRTIVTIITHLKRSLSEKVYRVSENRIVSSRFSDVLYHNGSVYLKGLDITGHSLYELYLKYVPDKSFNENTRQFLRIVRLIIASSEKINHEIGEYPPILLNSIIIAEDNGEITYLPLPIVDFINKYYGVEKQHILYSCINQPSLTYRNDKSASLEGSERDKSREFISSLAKLVYMFLTKNDGTGIAWMPVYYLGSYLVDIPVNLADALWDLLHSKEGSKRNSQICPDDFKKLIDDSLDRELTQKSLKRIPLLRRTFFINARHRTNHFLSTKWKFMLITAIISGIIFYLLSDVFRSRRKLDYTGGLTPEQVVELYYSGVNDLDLDIVNAVFYKRQGKSVKDELSTILVVIKMEQVFGKTLVTPDQLGSKTSDEYIVFGIKDLTIDKLKYNEEPVFLARYIRVISSQNKLFEYSVEEMIYLKKINDRWYITKNVRNVGEEEEKEF